jgi:hypothetical protein
MIKLRLLTDPKNTQSQKTHEIHHQPRSERGQPAPQIMFAVYDFHRGHAEIEHQQRHSEGKYAVAQGCEPLYTLSRNAVVRCGHFPFELRTYVAHILAAQPASAPKRRLVPRMPGSVFGANASGRLINKPTRAPANGCGIGNVTVVAKRPMANRLENACSNMPVVRSGWSPRKRSSARQQRQRRCRTESRGRCDSCRSLYTMVPSSASDRNSANSPHAIPPANFVF